MMLIGSSLIGPHLTHTHTLPNILLILSLHLLWQSAFSHKLQAKAMVKDDEAQSRERDSLMM